MLVYCRLADSLSLPKAVPVVEQVSRNPGYRIPQLHQRGWDGRCSANTRHQGKKMLERVPAVACRDKGGGDEARAAS